MRTPRSLLAVLAALVLTGSGCGADESDDVATDPAPTSSVPAAVPRAPVPDGLVRTRQLATVMDTGTPELCVGPIAESYPPQCGGPEITNWDWDTLGQRMFEQQGDIRWGTYLVTGTWDGTSFVATEAVPGALYDPAVTSEAPTPSPAAAYTDEQLQEIAQRLSDVLPGAQGAYGGDGHVVVDVFYDDGSLQEYVDATYGAGVVMVVSALMDQA